jgi:DNA (cytosine-5)-methyltransferase 1
VAAVPFIDIFAGPGGLSEGFSRFAAFAGGETAFVSRLAIEEEDTAVQTLRLRSFYRSFPEGEAPDDYYQVIRGKRSPDALALYEEWQRAEQHVWKATLGEEPEATLHHRIATALDGERNWVLLGGPPCQAYSLMGRARHTGIGAAARASGENIEVIRQAKLAKFAGDRRHKLYREYLRIVAVHQPAIFVMENVKGILSSRLAGPEGEDAGRVFEQIRADLTDPSAALAEDTETALLVATRTERSHRYRLYSLVVGGQRRGEEVKDSEFLIKSEEYGVPQKRHRVILLGVRDDVLARPKPLRRSPQATVRDAIGQFPPVRSSVSKADGNWADWVGAVRNAFKKHDAALPGSDGVREIICDFLCAEGPELGRGSPFIRHTALSDGTDLSRWYHDPRLNGFVQHEARSHMSSDLARYAYASATALETGCSPKLEQWPSQLLPNHRNVRYDAAARQTTAEGFSDRFKVQVWDEPSSTVTSHIAKDGHYFIHPDPMQCRSLTVREAARLQTFPDNYYFCGNRTQQYHQVGNAVPPYLACQVAGVVAKLLEDAGFASTNYG